MKKMSRQLMATALGLVMLLCEVCGSGGLAIVYAQEAEAQAVNAETEEGMSTASVLSSTSAVGSGTCGDLTWSLDSAGTLTISGTGDMEDYSYTQTPWYSYKTSIKKIVVKNGVTSISNYAFSYTGAVSVEIADSVTSIGKYAFYYSEELTDISLPSNLEEIGRNAFYGTAYCEDSDNWSGDVLYLDHWVIGSDPYMEGDYTIASGTVGIADFAFAVCDELTDITIPSSVSYIGLAAFYGCDELADSAGRIIIKNIFFGYCGSATSVTVPSGTTRIDPYAFYSNDDLVSVSIPTTVTSIGAYAFDSCSSLKSITFPSGLTFIGEYAFEYCTSLTSIVIPSGVTAIKAGTFDRCSSLASVTISSGVTSIGAGAFAFCDSLTKIKIPDTVTELITGTVTRERVPYKGASGGGSGAGWLSPFYGCESLASVTLSKNLTEIPELAFMECYSLSEITIPDGVISIGECAFCGTALTSITIPGSVKTIGTEESWEDEYYGAFGWCTELTTVVMEEGVEFIGYGSFIGCTSLKNVTIPSSVTTVCGDAFYYCSSLTAVTIPKSVENIGSMAFGYTWDNGYCIVSGFVISGYAGSEAQTYAKDNGITFYDLSSGTVVLDKCSVSYINNTMDGLKVVWNQVAGATGYYIYRRNDDGTYSTAYTAKVTGESTTTWTDTSTLTGGKDYTYKVAAYYKSSDGTITVGPSGTTKTCKYLKGGEVTSVSNTSSGLKVTWTKVSGANGYYIFRKAAGESDYTQVATVSGTSVVSWTDTSSLTSGKNYTYKVSAIFTNSKGQVTKGGAKTTKTTKYLSPGKISSIANTSGGAYIKWTKVTGATGYYVYRKASSASSYTLVKTITSVGTVSYTDTAVVNSNNVTYTYYIQPYFKSSVGVITKAGYTTKTMVRLVAPTISSLTNSASKTMTVKWGKKSGVTGYQVQYSASSTFASGNKTLTITGASSSSKVISSLTKGKTYYVRIRTYKTVNGTTYYSAWCTVKSVKISK